MFVPKVQTGQKVTQAELGQQTQKLTEKLTQQKSTQIFE